MRSIPLCSAAEKTITGGRRGYVQPLAYALHCGFRHLPDKAQERHLQRPVWLLSMDSEQFHAPPTTTAALTAYYRQQGRYQAQTSIDLVHFQEADEARVSCASRPLTYEEAVRKADVVFTGRSLAACVDERPGESARVSYLQTTASWKGIDRSARFLQVRRPRAAGPMGYPEVRQP